MQPDEQLDSILDAMTRGDSGAFMRVVQTHGLMLRSYIGAQVFNASDVDDLAQESFIAAFQVLHHYRRGEDFGAWLRGIARNKVLMFFRSSQRRLTALEEFRAEVAEVTGGELDAQSTGDHHESIAALLRCIAKLPEKLRPIVDAGLEGQKARTLAESPGISPGALYQLHCRANQLLRDCTVKEVRDA